MTEQNISEQRKINRLYGAFAAALVLSIVPSMIAAFLSLAFLIGVLIGAYIVRTDTEAHSFLESHATYIVHTIWVGSFYALVTISFASIYLFYHVNNTPLDPCIHNILSLNPQSQLGDLKELQTVFASCWQDYMHENLKTFIYSGVIAAAPILIYFLTRFMHGLRRSLKGYRVSNARKGWF